MSRFNQIKYPKDNPELEALYQDAMEIGFIGREGDTPNNWVTSQSERPDFLKVSLGFAKTVQLEGLIPPTVKQMILMTLAMQENCRYCEVGHTKVLEAMGIPTEVIRNCASDPELSAVPPSQRAILKFALKAARDRKSLTDEDFQTLRDYGFSDPEIMEVIMVLVCSELLNIWADVSGIAVDGEEDL